MHLRGVLLFNIPDLDEIHGLRFFHITLLSFFLDTRAGSQLGSHFVR